MRNFFFINLCALFVLLTVQVSFAGSLTDLRDGKTYKTVTILGQEWMAENLNLEYNVGTAKSGCLMVKGNLQFASGVKTRNKGKNRTFINLLC